MEALLRISPKTMFECRVKAVLYLRLGGCTFSYVWKGGRCSMFAILWPIVKFH